MASLRNSQQRIVCCNMFAFFPGPESAQGGTWAVRLVVRYLRDAVTYAPMANHLSYVFDFFGGITC